MKKLILLVALFVSPVFAQEEEQEVQIEIESGDGVQVAAAAGETRIGVVANADMQVWLFLNRTNMYCWVDEDNEPHCKEVDAEN